MGDVASVTPELSATVQAIYNSYEQEQRQQIPRTYLGASIIGAECDRFLWYQFRHCTQEQFNGRMLRLFETGQQEEARMADDLQRIGCEVYQNDPSTGQQFEFSAVSGHVLVHLDGAALGVPEAPETWHLLEFKTHNDKSFKELKKKGIADSKPLHYAQCMAGMYMSGLRRALYFAKNKDAEELYTDRIRYDADEAKKIIERAKRIIESNLPPPGVASRPDDFRCKFCSAYSVCWGGMKTDPAVPLPLKSCRQCCHATPITSEDGGKWHCKFYDKYINTLQPCENHVLLPDLVTFAAAVDSESTDDGEWIVFENDSNVTGDSAQWLHGTTFTSSPVYSTELLMQLPGPMVGDAQGGSIKDVFTYYPPADCEILWEGGVSNLTQAWSELFEGDDINQQTPANTYETDEYTAAEYEGAVVACVDKNTQLAAIIRGKN